MYGDLSGSFLRAFGLAILAGLGAFPTALLLIGAVLLGKNLDIRFGTQPLFLIVLSCIAVPLNIFIMLLLARMAIRAAGQGQQVVSSTPVSSHEEDDH